MESNASATAADPLSAGEPEFARYWFAHSSTNDPQFERWVAYEADQLEKGRERVDSIAAKHFPVAGRRVLDLGSQWGATCVALCRAGAVPVGIDISDELSEGARIRAREQGIDGPNRLSPANFRSDPHFETPGVSVLPEWLGRFYMMRLRGYPEFPVGTFPIAVVIAHKLRREGLGVVATSQRSDRIRSRARFNLDSLFWIHARRDRP